jgi:hypothetical protein
MAWRSSIVKAVRVVWKHSASAGSGSSFYFLDELNTGGFNA